MSEDGGLSGIVKKQFHYVTSFSHSLTEEKHFSFISSYPFVSVSLSPTTWSLLSFHQVLMCAHTHTQSSHNPAGEVWGERVSVPLGSEWFGDSVIQPQLAVHNNMKLARSIFSGDVSMKPCRDPISTQRNFETTCQRLFVCPFMQKKN